MPPASLFVAAGDMSGARRGRSAKHERRDPIFPSEEHMNILSQTVPVQYDTGFSPYPAAGWREAFADVAKKGLTGVEIAVAYPDRLDAAAVFNEAQENGLKITTLSTGQICGLEGAFLTAPDPEKQRIAIDAVRGHIALSVKLGLPNVTVGLLRAGAGRDAEGLSDMLKSALYPLCLEAHERGVMLQLEPINHNEATLFNNTADCVRFIDDLGAPTGLLYDTYHSRLEDGDMLKAIRLSGKRITNVHLCDSHRGLPGEGDIDFPAVCLEIIDTGYTGAFALETKCIPSREHILSHYADSIKQAVL